MSNEITMPKLSDTMEEGKILRWLKHPGDEIHHGDAIAEVETDKADMVMEAFDDGVLQELKLKEGESARVGAVIAVITPAGEAKAPAHPIGQEAEAAETASPEAAQEGSTAETNEQSLKPVPSARSQRRRREGPTELRAAEPRPARERDTKARAGRTRSEPREADAEYQTNRAPSEEAPDGNQPAPRFRP
ncbi:MAG: biotin/lipoyl-containing protein, partial [Candidatus Binataceae bacterium]